MKKVLVYLDPATGTMATLPSDVVVAVSKYDGLAERPYLIRYKDAFEEKVIVQSKDALWVVVSDVVEGGETLHPGEVKEVEHAAF